MPAFLGSAQDSWLKGYSGSIIPDDLILYIGLQKAYYITSFSLDI
jgi:hypothetical protein